MISLPLSELLSVFLFASTLMLLLWLTYLQTKNPTIVDLGWTMTIVFAAWFYGIRGGGDVLHRAIVIAMVTFWGLRLSSHLFMHRILPNIEDGRYTQLKKIWTKNTDGIFLGFFEVQAVVATILSIPFLIIAQNSGTSFTFLEWTGLILWGGALTGEYTADRQLERFRKNPENRGRTCRVGLWKYSRHPNYFFEWLTWCGYFLLAIPAPLGTIAIVSPILMLFLILKVSGIPPTEDQSLRSRGDDYRNYQKTTSAFIPWFPKKP